MNRHRKLIAVFAAVTFALALVAMASGRPSGTGQVSGDLSVMAVWSGAEQKNFEAVLAGFEKANPQVDVKYTSAGDQLATVLSTAVSGGNPPDLAVLPQPGLMKDFASQGALKSIAFARADLGRNFAADWIKLGTVNGKLYGLFFKGANKATVWYNVKAFRDAGVKPPKTFPQLIAGAKTLRASGIPAYSIAGADGWTLTDLFENIYLRQAGPARYDQLTAHKIKWTHPSVKAALRTMAQILGDSSNIAGGTSGALQTDFPTSVTQVYAGTPKAAMVMEGDFVAGVITDSTKAKPIRDFNVFAFPSIGGSGPSVVGGGDVVVMFDDNPAARALLKYLATPAAATIWAKRGGFSSPNKNVGANAYPDAITRTTATGLANAKTFRFDLSDLQPGAFGATVGQGLFKLFPDFLKNPKNVNGIAKQMETAAAKAYK